MEGRHCARSAVKTVCGAVVLAERLLIEDDRAHGVSECPCCADAMVGG